MKRRLALIRSTFGKIINLVAYFSSVHNIKVVTEQERSEFVPRSREIKKKCIKIYNQKEYPMSKNMFRPRSKKFENWLEKYKEFNQNLKKIKKDGKF